MPLARVGEVELTDALPKNVAERAAGVMRTRPGFRSKVSSRPRREARRQPRVKPQVRTSRPWSKSAGSRSSKAKNAEASVRGHMVDIGRGNQQAGRQGEVTCGWPRTECESSTVHGGTGARPFAVLFLRAARSRSELA